MDNINMYYDPYEGKFVCQLWHGPQAAACTTFTAPTMKLLVIRLYEGVMHEKKEQKHNSDGYGTHN